MNHLTVVETDSSCERRLTDPKSNGSKYPHLRLGKLVRSILGKGEWDSLKRITPDITVDRCEEALGYYQSIFGGELKNVQKADGKGMFEGHAGKIMHAELHINQNCVIYLVDQFDTKKAGGSSISLVLDMESEDELKQIYSALSKDGKVVFELQKTFWGAHHGIVTDRFGVMWALNYQLNS
ncbi:MAG: VOC family protein [Bacillota bacterium]